MKNVTIEQVKAAREKYFSAVDALPMGGPVSGMIAAHARAETARKELISLKNIYDAQCKGCAFSEIKTGANLEVLAKTVSRIATAASIRPPGSD